MSNIKNFLSFKTCIQDLINNPEVISMENIKQHISINCLEHSLFVSYISFRFCWFMGWDFLAAARGGLLHDLFLYDQHNKENYKGAHLRTHPKAALSNAVKICMLSDKEKDIILKHMWPLTFKLPKYKESFVVNITDTICALIEMLSIYKKLDISADIQSLLTSAV